MRHVSLKYIHLCVTCYYLCNIEAVYHLKCTCKSSEFNIWRAWHALHSLMTQVQAGASRCYVTEIPIEMVLRQHLLIVQP